MKRNKVIVFLAISTVCFFLGYLFTNSYRFGVCSSVSFENTYDVSCHIRYESIGDPLFYGMGALALVFFALLLVPQAISIWKKFALWFIPLMALVFVFYPNPGAGDFFSPYPEQIYQWLSALYVLISFVIIGYSKIRKQRARVDL